jgi:hypothetical protein
MKLRNSCIIILLLLSLNVFGQEKKPDSTKTFKADTVIVSLAKTTRVVFTIEDRADLELLKHYDFQALFRDILNKIESSDTTGRDTATVAKQEDWSPSDETTEEEETDEEWEEKIHEHNGRIGRTWQSFNFDLGTNNYLSDGKFPDSENELYSVRPWGSWYVGASSVQRTRLATKFFLEWGFGISWYNFKFQENNVLLVEDGDAVTFVAAPEGEADYTKSKLTATFINASLIPIIDFGDHGKKQRFWDGYHSAFRFGVGPYIGYRIDSYSKIVYKEDDDKEKDKDHDNFYLNNFRYGARLQLGFRSTDLFFNYDFNELFTENKGPKLNAFSFGVIF